VGGAVGWWVGSETSELVYDAIFYPTDKEEWVIVMCGDRPLHPKDLE
jgi:hypothetical protein